MQKAIFFGGYGTAYQHEAADDAVLKDEGVKAKCLLIYPETLAALRFVTGRGFLAVLATPNYAEYKSLVAGLQGKALSLYHFDIERNQPAEFSRQNDIDLTESYFITDGQYLETMQKAACKIILVLSGQGYDMLLSMEDDELNSLTDICKDIYAAAFSVAGKLL